MKRIAVIAGLALAAFAAWAGYYALRTVEVFEERVYTEPTYYQYEQVTRIGAGGQTYTTMEYVQHQTPTNYVWGMVTDDGGVTYHEGWQLVYLPVRTSAGFRPVTNWTVGVAYESGLGRLCPTNLYLLGGESLVLSGTSSGGTNSAVTLLLER